MTISIPWGEHAVFIHHVAAVCRRISGKGTLRQMVNRVAAVPISEWQAYTIFLPDRRIAPFDYGAADFGGLVSALALERPWRTLRPSTCNPSTSYSSIDRTGA